MILAFSIAPAAEVRDVQPSHAFDIPAGPAAETLKTFAAQTGPRERLLYSARAVAGIRTHAVKAATTARDALERMVRDTGLRVHHDVATGTLTLERVGPAPAEERAAPRPPTASESAPRSRLRAALGSFLALLSTSVTAQTAPGSGTSGAAGGAEVVVLSAFEVSTGKDRGYGTTHTVGGTRINVAVIDAPVSVVTVPEEMIRDLGYANVSDTLQFVSGVSKTSGSNNGQMVIRGVANSSPFGFVDGIDTPTGAPVGHSLPSSAALERIEVIKGPDGVLYGNGSLGGVINRIYRRPLRTPRNEIQVGVASYDTYEFTFDSAGPLKLGQGEPKLFYRLIHSRRDGETPQTEGSDLSHEVTRGELNWFPAPRTKVWGVVDFHYYTAGQAGNLFVTRTSTARGAPAEIPWNLPRRLNLGNPGFGGNDQHEWNYEIGTTHSREILGGEWTLRAVGRRQTLWGAFEPYPLLTLRFVDANGLNLGNTNQILYSDPRWRDIQIQSGLKRRRESGRDFSSANLDLTGKFATGPVKHTMLVFGSINYAKTDLNESRWDWNPEFQSIFRIQSRPESAVLSNYRPDSPRAFVTTFSRGSHVSIQENAAIFDGRLIGVAGIRFNKGRSNTLLPLVAEQTVRPYASNDVRRYGVVAKPFKGRGVALFYNRSEIFLGDATVHAPSGIALPERFGRQKEYGLKLEMMDGRLVATASKFDISTGQSIVTTLDPATGNNVYTLRDAILNRGYEADIAFQPLSSVTLFASYQWLESKENLTGARQRGVPQGHNYSLVAKYTVPSGKLARLGVGVAFKHSGDFAGDLPDTFNVPGYDLTNVFLQYPFRRFDVQLNINNVFSERFIETGVSNLQLYGAPGRSFQLRVAYRL
jgi:iron complex outermembrane receptor protein